MIIRRKAITWIVFCVASVILIALGWSVKSLIWEEWVLYNLSIKSKRRWAIVRLGEMRTTRALYTLLNCIPKEAVVKSIQERENRDALHHALQKIGKPAVPHLILMLDDGPGPIRNFVVSVLEWIYQTSIRQDAILVRETDCKKRIMLWLKSLLSQRQEEDAILRAAADTLSRLEGT